MIRGLVTIVVVLVSPTVAADPADEPIACAYLRMANELHDAYLAQIDAGKEKSAAADSVMIRETMQFACSARHKTGARVSYDNGKAATSAWNTPRRAFSWPNGKPLTESLAPGGAFYWPNGKLMMSAWGKKGTLYWPNGKQLAAALAKGSAWSYANGKKVSLSLGNSGATWHHPDGSLWTSDGPAIDEAVLLDRPGCIVALAVKGTLPDATSCPALVASSTQLRGTSEVKAVVAACERAHADDRAILTCIRDAAKR